MNKIATIIIFVIVVFSSCQKNITIKQLPYKSQTSIQCLLTPNTLPKLSLSNTVPYLDAKVSNRSLFIDNALVVISSTTNNDTLKIDSTFNNFTCEYEYFYIGKINTIANANYNLYIKSNGNEYKASTITSPIKVNIDSVNYVQKFKDVYGEHEGIVFHFTDNPTQTNFYRSEMHRNIDSSRYSAGGVKSPCLGATKMPVTEIGRTVYPENTVQGNEITFTIEPTYKHKMDDTTYLFLQSCDKNMYDFYDQIDRQKLAQYNPFVEPVYLKPTQFTNAIGVFGSFTISDSVLFVYPE